MASLHEVEADVAETRARLYDTIDRIQDKLTVTGIVDEVMGSVGVPRYEAGHDFMLGLMRRHPVPMMVAAAGIGFLIYRMNRRAAGRDLTIADADYVDVGVVNDGQAPAYDPDLPSRRPSVDAIENRRAF